MSTSLEVVNTPERQMAQLDALPYSRFKDLYFAGAQDESDVQLAYAICQRTGLDPVARQICFLARWDSKQKREVMTPVTTIDGFRVLAQRSHKYTGQVGPWWCGKDGQWREAWLEDGPPRAAKVGICRADFTQPLYAVATMAEYCAFSRDGTTPQPLWRKMPALMLAKCAEALAIRKAFPNDCQGLYTQEEMDQAGPQRPAGPKAQDTPEGQRFLTLAKAQFGQNKADLVQWIAAQFEGKTFGQLTAAEMGAAADLLASVQPESKDDQADPDQADHYHEQRRFFAVLKDRGLTDQYEGPIAWWAGRDCGWPTGAKGRPSMSLAPANLVRLASQMLTDFTQDDLDQILDDYRCSQIDNTPQDKD